MDSILFKESSSVFVATGASLFDDSGFRAHRSQVRYRVLACDYDGTIASGGVVDADTLAALQRLSKTGRKLVLVTGRELDSLFADFPGVELFDWVVAENGALLYRPATREERALGPPPPPALIARLREGGVRPLSIGRVIVATWEPHETYVLECIRELGLELQVIFNKGAVMVLPSGINKRSGLESALQKLGLSAHNCVGVGDAENDHAFLSMCECSVAVSNALLAVREEVDWVTQHDHGKGVVELIDRLIEDDLASLEPRLARHHLLVGTTDSGDEVDIGPYGRVVLVAGSSGSGKSTAATSILERLADNGYQVCIVDPEGDYEGFESAVTAGSTEQPPDIEQVLHILARPENHAVVNMLGVPFDDRPTLFLRLLSRLQELRASVARPHWVVIDEAHHVLGQRFEPARMALPKHVGSLLLITVHPESINRALLEQVDTVIAAGTQAQQTLQSFAQALERVAPEVQETPEQAGQALFWEPHSGQIQRIQLIPGRTRHQRHRRKYARGELGPDKSFFFRGPTGKLNLRAHNLVVFNQIGAGVDDETWLFHLGQGAYSSWIREAIKDPALAEQVSEVEANTALSARASRDAIRRLIEEKYTLPA